MADVGTDAHASDALVFFGATGDLAHKKIFPALYRMVKRGALTVPVIGVAHSQWNLSRLREHVRDSITQADGASSACSMLCAQICGQSPISYSAISMAHHCSSCPVAPKARI